MNRICIFHLHPENFLHGPGKLIYGNLWTMSIKTEFNNKTYNDILERVLRLSPDIAIISVTDTSLETVELINSMYLQSLHAKIAVLFMFPNKLMMENIQQNGNLTGVPAISHELYPPAKYYDTIMQHFLNFTALNIKPVNNYHIQCE